MSFESLETGFTGSHANAAGTTVGSLTFTVPAGAHCCYLTVETNNVYATFDGTVPTSTNGIHILKDTAPLFFPCAEKVIMLPETGTAKAAVLWMA